MFIDGARVAFEERARRLHTEVPNRESSEFGWRKQVGLLSLCEQSLSLESTQRLSNTHSHGLSLVYRELAGEINKEMGFRFRDGDHLEAAGRTPGTARDLPTVAIDCCFCFGHQHVVQAVKSRDQGCGVNEISGQTYGRRHPHIPRALGLAPMLDRIKIDSRFSAGAYGVADDAVVEAIQMGARLEALLFDPVYSGKGLAELIGLIRGDYFPPGARVLFLHTGGDPALFAHRSLFAE